MATTVNTGYATSTTDSEASVGSIKSISNFENKSIELDYYHVESIDFTDGSSTIEISTTNGFPITYTGGPQITLRNCSVYITAYVRGTYVKIKQVSYAYKYTDSTTITTYFTFYFDKNAVTKTFQQTGTFYLYLTVFDSDGTTVLSTLKLGDDYYIKVCPWDLDSIELSSLPTKLNYYKKETFNKSGLVVKRNMLYHIRQTAASSPTTTVYSLSITNSTVLTTIGTQTVTVSYTLIANGQSRTRTATFDINVYDAVSSKSSLDGLVLKLGDSLPSSHTMTIYYGDGTNETVSSTIKQGGDAIKADVAQTIYVEATSTKTGETVSASAVVIWAAPDYIVVGGTYPTEFYINDTFSSSGLVVHAYYTDLEGESVDVTSSVTISGYNMATTGTQNVSVQYQVTTSNNGTYYLATKYPIKVVGLESIRLDTSSWNNRVLKGGAINYSGLKLYWTLTDASEAELSLSSDYVSIDTSEINTGTTGTQTITITVTYHGVSKSVTANIVVYSLSSLVLSGIPSTPVYNSTFSSSGLVVTAYFSDGTNRLLTSSEYSITAPETLSVGANTITVSSTIGDTKTATYTVTYIEDYPVTITNVDVSAWNDTFVEGDIFSSEGIKVYATMASGATNVQIPFTTSLDGQEFGVGIVDDTAFTIYANSNGTQISYGTTYTALYDELQSFTVTAGSGATTKYKAGESFSLEGFTGTLTYAKSGNKSLSLDNSMHNHSGVFTSAEAGSVTITFSYKGLTASVTVTVIIIASLTITNTQTAYDRGEALDKTALTIKAIYSDGTTKTTLTTNQVTFNTTGLNYLIPDDASYYTNNKTISVSYTEAGVTATGTFSISIKCLSSVALYDLESNAVSKISFNYGVAFSLVGYQITETYNNGDTSTEVITSSSTLSCSPSIGEYIKSQVSGYIRRSFGGETKQATFTVHCVYLDRIVVNAATYIAATHYYGETLDVSSIVTTAYFASTDSDEADTSTPVTSAVAYSPASGNKLAVGDNEITVTYTYGSGNTQQVRNDSFTVTVEDIELQSISVTTQPTKLLSAYVEGQRLNVSGMVVAAVFNNTDENCNVDLLDLKYFIGTEEVAPNVALSTEEDGEYLIVKYTYNGETKQATVGTLSVAARVIDAIRVSSTSGHTDTFYIGDTFSTSKLVLEISHNDTDEYDTDVTTGFTTDFDGETFDENDVGSHTVTITYQGFTTTYDITVAAPALSKLEFNTSLIALSVKNGDTYDISGLVVTATFANGYSETINDWTSDVVTALSLDENNVVSFDEIPTTSVPITVTVTNPYDNDDTMTKVLKVSVTPNMEVKELKITTTSDDYDKYLIGDAFDAHGIEVWALFKDVGWQQVEGWESTIALNSILRSGGNKTVTITYTEGGIAVSASYTFTVYMSYESQITETDTYKVAFNVASITHEEATITMTDTFLPLFKDNVVTVCEDDTSEYYGLNIYTGNDANTDCIGYVDVGSTNSEGMTTKNAHIILFDDPVNPIDGDGNIVVTFPHYVSGYADRINKCHFGIIYNNRLFISGNPDYRNVDWHNGQVNTAQVEGYDINSEGDMTYFSDLDYCRYGSENTAVVGYDIYRDGTLLVFKTGSRHEATVYTRSYSLINASSYDGTTIDSDDSSYAEESYPCFALNAQGGDGAISNDTIVNFVGETIVLTKNGLKAVISKETTYNNAKYTYDVSSHINKVLKKENLEDAVMFTFDEKLFLKTPNYLFVGEYALRDDDTSEYEWFVIDNLDVNEFFEVDNELYFSDSEGKLKRFSEDDETYKDKEREYIGIGSTALTIDATNDNIIVNAANADKIAEGLTFHLLSNYSVYTNEILEEYEIHANLGYFINSNTVDNDDSFSLVLSDYVGKIDAANNIVKFYPMSDDGTLNITEYNDKVDLFYDGRRVFFDDINDNNASLEEDTGYYLKKVETVGSLNQQYQIVDEDGDVVDLNGIESFRMSFRISDTAITTITDIEDYGSSGAKTFKLIGDHNKQLDLIYYNGYNGTYRAVITTENHINSYYVTKPYNFDSLIMNKTIWSWVISNDTELDSYMDVGYLASRKQGDFTTTIATEAGTRAFNMNTRFDRVQFTNDKLPHIYSVFKTVADVGFIKFLFKNEVDGKMVLSQLSLVYTFSLLTKGVK